MNYSLLIMLVLNIYIIMKKFYVLVVSISCISIFWSCSKISTTTADQGTGTAEITEIGVSSGQAVNMTVGSGGGTLISDDGIMEIEIPTDALKSNTNISIEPITNNAPGGLGKGYRFGPSHTKFNKPVTLKFHYTDKAIKGTLPQFIGIAFQDSNRGWYSLRTFTYDSINKIIRAYTSHFTDYAIFLDLYIVPDAESVKVNESKNFKVIVLEPANSNELTALTPPKNGEAEVAPIRISQVNDGLVKNWAVNGFIGGNSQYGTITPHGAQCSFKAPATKPSSSKNPVQLSVEINMKYKDPLTGKDFTKLRLNAPVQILDNKHEYHLEIKYYDPNWEEAYSVWTVSDSAGMDIKIENDVAVITNYQNYNGNVTPASQPTSIGGSAAWISKDFVGYLTIHEVTGFASSLTGLPGSVKTLNFQITNVQRTNPAFNLIIDGQSSTMGGAVLSLDYYSAQFLLRDSDQVFHDPVTTQLVYKLTSK